MDFSKRQRTSLMGSGATNRPFSIGDNVPSAYRRDPNPGMIGMTPTRAPPGWRVQDPSPQSPAKRASQSVLGSRKILERPQGPSSRLASSTIRPAAPLPATTPRKIFKSSVANGESRFAFSPRVPHNTMTESFPAATPARSHRASTAEVHGRGMSRTTSTSLFNMRIASPPPELDGEALAKQVPDDPNRVGSVYADQFLTHLVPPDLDELQRRQFFCILDLRRLKYAANEIFAKKDWKINIMNFAKEYEKSRSLIMLRYGLYEFKTVPVSGDLMKKWKAENNVPSDDEEPEEATTPRANGTQGILARPTNKRRADDDLTKDSALTMSSSNQNKRRAMEPLSETSKPSMNVATPAPSHNKRRATVTDEEDENRQSKRATTTTPSATKALFEKVANNTPSTAATPAKPSKSVFESSANLKAAANPFATSASAGSLARSVLDKGAHATASATYGGIFGHLSDAGSAKGSGNEADADEESEEDEEAEEESEVQEVSQSDEPSVAASGGVATPSQFSAGASLFSKQGPGLSSTSSETGEAPSKGPSLFDRITKDANGNPVRAAEQPEASSLFGAKRAASPVKESSAPPSDNTWDPNTPIKFGAATKTPASSSLFAAKPDTPSAPAFSFGASAASKPSEATASTDAQGGSKPATSLFGQSTQTPASSSNIFSSASKPADSGAKLFGSSSMFGQPKKDDDKPTESAPSTSTTSLFGSQPAAPGGGSVLNSSTLFGAPSTSSEAKTPLFGAPKASDSAPAQPASSSLFGSAAKPSSNMFGAASQAPPANDKTTSLFGNATAQHIPTMFGTQIPAPTLEKKGPAEPDHPKPSEGVEDTNAGDVFGAKSSGAPKSFTFGGNAPAPAAKLPPKTDAAAKGSTEAADVFGAASSGGEKKYTFGAAPASTPAAEPKSIFGSASTVQNEPPKAQSSLFGASSTPSTGFAFGSQPSSASGPFGASSSNNAQPTSSLFGNSSSAPSNSFTFNAGGGQSAFNNPFSSGGDSSATPSFNFGTSSAGAGQGSPTPFAFGSSTPASSAPTSSFTFGAGSQATTSAPSQPSAFGGATNGGSSMFNFGGGASQSSAPSMFSQQQPANAAQSIFGHLNVPQGGTSTTGSNTPFFGGASSLATTPAAGTPEPETKANDEEQEADEDAKPQDQLNLSEGGPGEEDEEVLHEVRAKALKFVPDKPGSDSESQDAKKDKKNPWKTQGVGPLRLLKHKTTGAVRMLLRAEPRGHVALNRAVLPNFEYKVEKGGKYVKVMTGNDAGNGLETWMLQVKTNDAAKELAEALEANKSGSKE